MMRRLSTPFSVVCCSLGLLALTHCGGSNSDAEGFAPSVLGAKVMSIQITGITDANIAPADILEVYTDENGMFSAATQGEVISMWNGAGIYFYQKTGKNTASFSLVYNNNDGSATEPSSRMNSINVPQLTFRDDYHASSGEGGANIAYLEASDRQNPVTVPDVTVSVNFISQS